MLQQPNRLLLYQLGDHVTKHGADRIKALICLADVRQSHIVEQNLLDDKDGDRLG